MTLLGGNLNWDDWAKGLVAAFIGGGAGAFSAGLSAIIVDHNDFNIYTLKFWQLVFGTFVIGGLVPFFAYLHQKPIPDVKQVTTTVQTTTVGAATPKVVETVKETHVEPIIPKETKDV